LYKPKQEPRASYSRSNSFPMSLGFTKSKEKSNLYYKVLDGGPMILLLYVDGPFLTKNEKLIIECKRKLAAEFKMIYLGVMHYFLGLEVWQIHDDIFLCQGKYVVDILKKLKMMDCKIHSYTNGDKSEVIE
jgi:hypothetical protein